MKASGYGADLEYDGTTVTILPGKMARRLAGTDRIAFPVADVVGVKFSAPKLGGAVNGAIRFQVRDTGVETLAGYGGRLPVPPDGSDEFKAYAKQGLVTAESLVVAFRKKDADAFEAIHEAIRADVPA